mmetsp:Transcript_50827/g.159293  ORF Transcript_50827/g.159293 Transcript_50827/m.159293 type:complete len:352 (+) Transcript_50827:2-1057(+)
MFLFFLRAAPEARPHTTMASAAWEGHMAAALVQARRRIASQTASGTGSSARTSLHMAPRTLRSTAGVLATRQTYFSTSRGVGAGAPPPGQKDFAVSQALSNTVRQSGLKWAPGNSFAIRSQTSCVAASSTILCVTTSHTYFSTSCGLGMDTAPLGQAAAAVSQASCTTVWQSGLKWMLGQVLLTSSQILSTALSSIIFSVANWQINLSMSWGLGMERRPLGQKDFTASQALSTAVWQSGLKWTLGKVSLRSSQIASVAMSSIIFSVATWQTYFSMSWGLGIERRPLGQRALTKSQPFSMTDLQSGSNLAPGNSALINAQILSVACSSISFREATSHAYLSSSSGPGNDTPS